MTAHARLAPSSAHTWLRCTAMPRMSEGLVDVPKEWSAEGTAAHGILETCLRLGLDAWAFMGIPYEVEGFHFQVTEAWCRHLQHGLDKIRDLADKHNGKIYAERRVSLDRWLPGQFGTLDVGIIGPDVIIIFDEKFGQGLPVDVEENEQLRLYGLGFWNDVARHKTKAKKFRFYIDQPRVHGGGGMWECTLDELLAFGEYVRERGKETYTLDARFEPSVENCKFCKAAEQATCPALREFVMTLLKMDLEDVVQAYKLGKEPDFSKVESMTPHERAAIVKNRTLINKFLDSIYAKTLEDAEHGKPTPGLVLVEGKMGHRQWKDADRVKEILGKNFWIKKQISPAELEEHNFQEYKRVKKYVKQGRSRPTLAPKTSKRERVASYATYFKNLTKET